jgi:hypothetical protein
MPNILCPEVYQQENSPVDMNIRTGMKILDQPCDMTKCALESFLEIMSSSGQEYNMTDFVISSYKKEKDYFKEALELSDTEWKFFDFDGFILEEWSNLDCKPVPEVYILFKAECSYHLLEDIGKVNKVWEGKLEEFFCFHPMKETNFFIIRPLRK